MKRKKRNNLKEKKVFIFFIPFPIPLWKIWRSEANSRFQQLRHILLKTPEIP